MQTFNNGQKSKEIQSSKVELHVRIFYVFFFSASLNEVSKGNRDCYKFSLHMSLIGP